MSDGPPRAQQKREEHNLTTYEITCSVEGCNRKHVAKSYCSLHWQRFKKTGDPGPVNPVRQQLRRDSQGNIQKCIVTCCNKKQHAKRMCNRHNHMHSTFGLSVGAIERFESRQVCSIPSCGSTHLLRLDHDHSCCPGVGSCGKCVRGWLCHNCNSALGFVRDDENILDELKEYLGKGGWWKI